MVNFSRRSLLLSMGFGIGASALLASCGKKPIPRGILRVALIGGPDSLDPLRAEFAVAALLFRQYLLPIVGYGKNGEVSTEFAMSQSYKPNADFTKWYFKIKPNLQWSDGVPIDAAQIVASLQKSADWKTNYPDAPELYKIKNYKNVLLNKGDPKSIGVKNIGSDEIEISLETADANFPERMQEFYPVPLHAIEKYGDQWTNMGKIVVSGPFIPTTYTQTRIVFDKNLKGGWVPGMAQSIEVLAVDDSSARIRMFQGGDVDLSQDPALLRYPTLIKEYGDGFKKIKAPRLVYMSFNTKRPQFSNPLVRKALSLAFNRNKVSHNIMRDAVDPATRFIRQLPPIAQDLAQAKAIMEKLGFSTANPLRFELLVPKDDRERAAIDLSNQWKQIGVEAVISTVESTAISARLNGFDFDCAIVKIDKGMKSDPLDLMASFATGGNSYSHQWKNEKFDAALEKVGAISDENARLEALKLAEAILLEEVPIMPIWFNAGAWLQSGRISGGYANMQPIIWPSLRVND
jgi:oligopeptide transport system substrate-binding protein